MIAGTVFTGTTLSFIRFNMIISTIYRLKLIINEFNMLWKIINEVNLLKLFMKINLLADQKNMYFFNKFTCTLLIRISV